MTAIATQQIIHNGPRNLVLKYTIDGVAGDVTANTLVDISALDANIGVRGLRLDRAYWAVTGMSLKLQWEDADGANVDLLELANDDGIFDYSLRGGVTNNATLPTGNVVFTTKGYDGGGDGANMTLEFKKKSSTGTALQQDVEPSTGSIAFSSSAGSILNGFQPTLGSIAFTGATPQTFLFLGQPTLGSVAITGTTPVIGLTIPASLGSIAFTGNAPTIVNG